jgi:transposase
VEEEGLDSCKKNASRLKAYLVFSDESGFLLIPTVRRTFAPRGRTPRIYHRYRRDRISVISAISVSPQRRRLGLYFQCHRHNITQEEVCSFLRHLLRHLPGHVIVILDNGKIHKGEPIRELQKEFPRLHLEFFPAYAPELNPDENVWSAVKSQLANGQPDDLDDLSHRIHEGMRQLQRSQARLRACVKRSGLPPFLA